MTITGGTALSKDEIAKMQKEAEAFAAEDHKRREAAEARNQADSLTYQIDKALSEYGDKVPADEKQAVESGERRPEGGAEGRGRRPDQAGDGGRDGRRSSRSARRCTRSSRRRPRPGRRASGRGCQAGAPATVRGGGRDAATASIGHGDGDVVEGEIVEKARSSIDDDDRIEARPRRRRVTRPSGTERDERRTARPTGDRRRRVRPHDGRDRARPERRRGTPDAAGGGPAPRPRPGRAPPARPSWRRRGAELGRVPRAAPAAVGGLRQRAQADGEGPDACDRAGLRAVGHPAARGPGRVPARDAPRRAGAGVRAVPEGVRAGLREAVRHAARRGPRADRGGGRAVRSRRSTRR